MDVEATEASCAQLVVAAPGALATMAPGALSTVPGALAAQAEGTDCLPQPAMEASIDAVALARALLPTVSLTSTWAHYTGGW